MIDKAKMEGRKSSALIERFLWSLVHDADWSTGVLDEHGDDKTGMMQAYRSAIGMNVDGKINWRMVRACMYVLRMCSKRLEIATDEAGNCDMSGWGYSRFPWLGNDASVPTDARR